MDIRNYPFSTVGPRDIPRPYLLTIFINPETGKRLKVMALIDTGADECALPASFASLLGHNLQAGKKRIIETGSGTTTAYAHTLRIKIDRFVTQAALIDFLPNLHVPLLGVKSFLSHCVLTINYPKKTFSLKFPHHE